MKLTDLQEAAQAVPDSAKLTAIAAAPVLTILGMSLQEWTYVLSAIVSLFFILEKLPMVITRIKTFKKWIVNVRRKE